MNIFINTENKDRVLSLVIQQILKEINQAIKSLKWNYNIQDSDLDCPIEKEMGDFSLPCFKLAKELKRTPDFVAKLLSEKINPTEFVSSVKCLGGYLNFYVNKIKITPLVLNQIIKEKEKYGNSKLGKKEKIMIEFSSPNTSKPLHLGHVRNIVIGWSVSRLLETIGFKTIKTSLLNDRGIHICKVILSYKKWAENKKPTIKSDHFIGNYYVLFEKKLKENPDIQKELLETLNKLEKEEVLIFNLWEKINQWAKKDPSTFTLWKKINQWAEKGFKETYLKLGVSFDKVYRESKIYKKGKKIILDGLEKGIFKKDKDGAIIAKLEKYGLPDKVLLRSDGTSIYITQDIYLAILKFKEYKLKKSIYCVGNEQELYLKQLFKILEMLGYDWSKNCYHLNYGMVFLPEGKMKSREGKVVEADKLISDLKNLAQEEILKRNSNISEKKLSDRSLKVAISALKYYLLEINPSKNIYFNPKKSVSFNGRTGPYIQYSYARICSILKKAGRLSFHNINYSCLKNEGELELIMFLSKFPSVIEKSALNYNPAILAQYLYHLSEIFNSFYENFSVLEADKETKNARLLLINSTKIVFKKGLNLLGIDVLEKM
ncbi:MAG: arginine--tRNA ligase [Candidatus Nealsonbacteria bacterium]